MTTKEFMETVKTNDESQKKIKKWSEGFVKQVDKILENTERSALENRINEKINEFIGYSLRNKNKHIPLIKSENSWGKSLVLHKKGICVERYNNEFNKFTQNKSKSKNILHIEPKLGNGWRKYDPFVLKEEYFRPDQVEEIKNVIAMAKNLPANQSKHKNQYSNGREERVFTLNSFRISVGEQSYSSPEVVSLITKKSVTISRDYLRNITKLFSHNEDADARTKDLLHAFQEIARIKKLENEKLIDLDQHLDQLLAPYYMLEQLKQNNV